MKIEAKLKLKWKLKWKWGAGVIAGLVYLGCDTSTINICMYICNYTGLDVSSLGWSANVNMVGLIRGREYYCECFYLHRIESDRMNGHVDQFPF